MRFDRFFISRKNRLNFRSPGFCARLEEFLGVEFPAPFFYPNLVLLMVNETGVFSTISQGGSSGDGFDLKRKSKIPMRFPFYRVKSRQPERLSSPLASYEALGGKPL